MTILLRSAARSLSVALALAMWACAGATSPSATSSDSQSSTDSTDMNTTDTLGAASAVEADILVNIATTAGDIQVRLYGDTPRHRDNFVRLAAEGFYDGTLFHRVINDFMIQAGDPDSRNAPAGKRLGSGGPDYTIEAEIVYPRHFHRRGALAAARQGDQVNPERRSSGSQFYIVTGTTYSEGQLSQLLAQLGQQQQQAIFNRLAAARRDDIMALRRAGDQAGLQRLQEELIAATEAEAAANPATLTPEQRQAYTTVGGTPHLDGEYTVFGEVVAGMDVVDRIQKVPTDAADRPTDDIKILRVAVVE